MSDKFVDVKKQHQQHINQMFEKYDVLYTVIEGTGNDEVEAQMRDQLPHVYMNNFSVGMNEIFRTREEHNCANCFRFIRQFAHIVAINEQNELITIWDFDAQSDEYQPSVDALAKHIKSLLVTGIFVTKEKMYGTDFNIESGIRELEDGTKKQYELRWEHFYTQLPKKFINTKKESEATQMGIIRDNRNALKRSLEELSQYSVNVVLELIATKQLHNGEGYLKMLQKFKEVQDEYMELLDKQKDNYCWRKVTQVGGAVAKMRTTTIGTLLQDITKDVDLDIAVAKYLDKEDPLKKNRPKGKVRTERQVKQALQRIQELGLESALERQHADLSRDIALRNVLWANSDTEKKLTGNTLFDKVLKKVECVDPKKFSKIETMSVEHFISKVLPTTTSVEVLYENRFQNNLMNLLAPVHMNAGKLFRWNNLYCHVYHGNVTDSLLKQQVISLGGRVDVPFRMSSSWNHPGKRNQSLMDFHVFFPTNSQESPYKNGVEIHDRYGNTERVGWNNRRHPKTGGNQDVDYTSQAPNGYIPVENIVLPDLNKLLDGVYTCKAHNWNFRSTGHGFKSEIEFGDQLLEFEYDNVMEHKEWVTIARIELKNKQWTVLESLPTMYSSKELWDLQTQQFHPISTIMMSPNCWDNQRSVGQLHYLFFVDGLKNPESVRGIFTAHLREELRPDRQVFEVLGRETLIPFSDIQMAGVGFNGSLRNEIILRLKGSYERVVKVTF